MTSIAMLVLGLGVLALAAAVVVLARRPAPGTDDDEGRRRLEQALDAERAARGEADTRAAALAAQRDEARRQAEALTQRIAGLERQLDETRAQLARAEAERARLQERELGQQERLAWLEQSREQLAKEFEQLSAKIFEHRSKQLQEQNRTGVEDMLRPFREQLESFRRQVGEIHGQELKNQAEMLAELRNLQALNQQMVQDARNLTEALKGGSKAQGNWGELVLERVLESSGLVKGREYAVQVSFTDEDGRRKQPDVIVHLPDGKDIIIDAKVSLVAWEEHCSATDEDARQAALARHVQSLRAHVKGLDRKEYEKLEGVRTLDFVVLFIPIEAAFVAALEAAPDIFTEAWEHNIVLVSPATLLVTLRTIHNIWRYEYQNRNALEIARSAGGICDQVSLVEESLRELGNRLDQARNAWDTTYNRLSSGRGNLLNRAHTLRSLGAKARRALPEPAGADDVPDDIDPAQE